MAHLNRLKFIQQHLLCTITCLTALSLLPMQSLAHSLEHTRGLRYCEVILLQSSLNLAVYNTINLNDCPDHLWKKLNTQTIKKETNALFVHLNGPRYFIFDAIKNANVIDPAQKNFGGIAMRKTGILHIKLSELLFGNKPYATHQVDRETTWVYKAGKPVYELVNPKGEVFVMQSYSVQCKPQTQASLSNLGHALTLPQGWHFYTGILQKTSEVVAIDKKAVVITDDYCNTYQKAASNLLEVSPETSS